MSDPRRTAEKADKRAAADAKFARETEGVFFQGWPKIYRLNREIIITEKIDGTNSAIGIGPPAGSMGVMETDLGTAAWQLPNAGKVWAQSRKNLITPQRDNMGFARWVEENREVLTETLGPGLHFGEWWGSGIQRGYGVSNKRFSLFNVSRWGPASEGEGALIAAQEKGVQIGTVPVLYRGPWHIRGTHASVYAPDHMIDKLTEGGSRAAPGFMRPEGIVVFHTASGISLKVTVEKDAEWKGNQ